MLNDSEALATRVSIVLNRGGFWNNVSPAAWANKQATIFADLAIPLASSVLN